MLKKGLCLMLALLLLLLASASAIAELTNQSLQMMGGLACVNKEDMFFFAPINEYHWGLYSVNTCAQGPIAQIDGYTPARMVYADGKDVYFIAFMREDSTLYRYGLYVINMDSGAVTTLLENLDRVFVEKDTALFYVKQDKLNVLWHYDLTTRTSKELKALDGRDMIDAATYDDTVFLLTQKSNGAQDVFHINKGGKALLDDAPKPKPVQSMLYAGYRIYTTDTSGRKLYAAKLGTTKSVQLAEGYANLGLSLSRVGTSFYLFDTKQNEIVCIPMDGSPVTTLALVGEEMTCLVIGGSDTEVLFIDDDMMVSASPSLANRQSLFPFALDDADVTWAYLLSYKQAVIAFGYMVGDAAANGMTVPSAVRVMDRATGDVLFSFGMADTGAAGDLSQPESGDPDVFMSEPDEFLPVEIISNPGVPDAGEPEVESKDTDEPETGEPEVDENGETYFGQ